MKKEQEEEIDSKVENIKKILSEMSNEDETISQLEKAMNYFCSTWDKCEGFKHAIMLTLTDQHENHFESLEVNELDRLSDILNRAT